MLKRFLLISVVAAVLIAALVYSQVRTTPLHVSGFIEAHEVRVASRVGGRVAKVLAVEGARVKKGDALVEFEPYDLREKQAQAKSEMEARQAEWERLKKGFRPEEIAQAQAAREMIVAKLDRLIAGPRKQEIATAEARLAQAEVQVKLAQSNYDRVKSAFASKSTNQEDMDRATDSLNGADANLKVRRQELDLLKEGTRKEEIAEARAQLAEAEATLALRKAGYRSEEIAAAEAAATAARAAMAAIDRQVAELTIRSPLEGVVQAVELRPGDMLGPNAPALTLLDTGEMWVRAYVPENRMSLKDGQRVKVTVDSFPGRSFAGHVSFLSSQAEFTPGNVQTPEERSKQVFRIKVTLDEGLDVLRAGMSADVWLEKTPAEGK